MQISSNPWRLLLLLLLFSICFIETYGKGGRGGGSRGRGSSTRIRRPTSRPAPRATYRPAPAPAPKATYRPAPAPKPSARPQPAASAKPPSSNKEVVAKQPAENPNFKESNPNQGSSANQPAYNPNYKPNSNAAPGGPPPPYSPGGQPAPNAPVGPPPPYHPNQPNAPLGQPPPYGAPGQRPPYPSSGQAPPYPVQPPSYPGLPGRPPSYPGQAAPYPVQPGSYPNQQGGMGSYPGGNRPYPVQPGMHPGANRPYPVQPGGYPGSYPGGYPGSYPGGYPGGYSGGQRPYPQQPLGGNVWQPQSGRPAPAYMNYGGLPTGTNMYSKPHKQKGFLGSLMSFGGGKHKTQNKYHGSHPSPYGAMAGGALAGGGLGYMAGRGMGKMGGVGSFLGGYKSAAMFAILPFMAMRMGSSLFRPSFGMPFFGMPHMHYGRHYGPEYAHYYDIYDTEYAGKCARPLAKKHSEVKCKSDYKKIECQAKCEDGYRFADNVTYVRSNKCWHVTGVWVPAKNFPVCSPVCEEDCENGGECVRPGFCSCPDEFRGDQCQFLKSDFLDCDFRQLTKGMKVGWVCTHSKNETSCRVQCNSPGVFEVPPADAYKCTPGGRWTPDALPPCVVKG